MSKVILVTGPSRSGKSEWAEDLAIKSGKSVIYIATATLHPGDAEWQERIEKHKQRRPEDWVTVDAPEELTATLSNQDLRTSYEKTNHVHRKCSSTVGSEEEEGIKVLEDDWVNPSNIEAKTLILIDSLGTWVANCLEQDDSNWEKTCKDLLATVPKIEADLVFVAEETGWGVVPAYPLGRKFRDRLGSLVRQLGAICDTVYLVTGGYVLDLTHLGIPLAVK